MQKPPLGFRAAPLAVIALLAACGSQPENVTADAPADPDAANVAEAPPAPLPPMLRVSDKSYRCKDNSVVYLDFFADNVTAALRTQRAGTSTKLVAPEAGKAFTGGGYTLSGSGPELTLTAPGKSAQTCKG